MPRNSEIRLDSLDYIEASVHTYLEENGMDSGKIRKRGWVTCEKHGEEGDSRFGLQTF